MKSTLEPSGPSARRLSWFLQHETTRSICISPLDGILVHRRVTPSIKFTVTHSHTWVERGTLRVKCLTQEYKAMSLTRVQSRIARSGDERTMNMRSSRKLPLKQPCRSLGSCNKLSAVLRKLNYMITAGSTPIT